MKKTQETLFIKPIVVAFLLIMAIATCISMPYPGLSTACAALHTGMNTLVPFIENRGQADKSVRYYAHMQEATVFVTADGMLGYCVAPGGSAGKERLVIREKFVAAGGLRVQGDNRSPAVINYFKGGSQARWLRNLPASMTISLGEVYKGIETKIQATAATVEKLFIVKPHARADRISIAVEGAHNLSVSKQGCLQLDTGKGMLIFSKPVAFQQDGAGRKYVDIAYVVKGHHYGFKVGRYDTSRELVIDPLLASTFLGGQGPDYAKAIITDSSGNVYVGGQTSSSDFPTTPGAYQTTGSGDAFITKFDTTLQTVLSSTFLGGGKTDIIYALSLDTSGNIYAGGYTMSNDFPVSADAYDTTFGGSLSDAFVAKLDADLSTLKKATYLGGSGVYYDYIYALTVDSSNNVYVAGNTQSATDFPATAGAYDGAYNGGETDAFAAKFNDNLTDLQAATLLGGEGADFGYGIARDEAGNIYVTGRTLSADMPTTAGAYDTVYDGDDDAYVAKFDANLATLTALTYLNGSHGGEDIGNALAIDSSGTIIVAGETSSTDFPTTAGAYSTTRGGGGPDGFITKLSANLQTVLASTFLGGEQNDWINALVLDSSGNIVVAGETWADDFPLTADSDQPNCNLDKISYSAFAAKLDSGLKKLCASTYLCGASDDTANGVAVDANGSVFVCGQTNSPDFPATEGAYDEEHNNGIDGFVTKLDLPACSGSSDDCTISGILPPSIQSRPLPHIRLLRLTGDDFGLGFARVTFTGPQEGGIRSVFALALGSRVVVLARVAAGVEPGEYAVEVTRSNKTCSGVSLTIE
ncbi:MAG: SBBP repeat-containing protein [Deltaproteobacteria bacterium]|nr:SBBP repeat-containing protein [Deltaproteobacteria bacterium]